MATAKRSSDATGAKRTAASTLKRGASPNAAPLVFFFELDWSDGVLQMSDGTINAPPDDMIKVPESEPNADDYPVKYMRAVESGGKKEMDWLLKLGEASMTQQDPNFLKKTNIKPLLHRLPENYRLYEQFVIQKPGAKARVDTYLYGHPGGPRKRFRSPQDFAKHMYWLLSDASKEKRNCRCLPCSGKGFLGLPTGGEAAAKPAASARPKTPSSPASPATVLRNPSTRRSASNPPLSVPTAPMATAETTATTNFYGTRLPVPLDVILKCATHPWREKDIKMTGTKIFRLGEQVWIGLGSSWALGAVTHVAADQDLYNIHLFTSPLSNATTPHHNVQPQSIRPWLAWSTPAVSDKVLAQCSHDKPYISLPWDRCVNNPAVDVDASIIKARTVDRSYTLIDRLTPNGSASDIFNGVYIGGEKFWIGDAVRLKQHVTSNPNDFLIVTAVKDNNPTAPCGVSMPTTNVEVIGHLCRFVMNKQQFTDVKFLPFLVQEELKTRNVITLGKGGFATALSVNKTATFKLEDLKGRWYPSAPLQQIMNGMDEYNKNVASRTWKEEGSRMNELGAQGNVTLHGWIRYACRKDAFAGAIPAINFPDGKVVRPNQTPVAPVAAPVVPIAQPPVQSMNSMNLGRDLTGAEDGLEYLRNDHADDDDAFMRKMEEDAANFIDLSSNGDGFYQGL